MTGRRNIIIAVGAIVIFAAIVGFFITLDVSPQIAYARLFIDLGLAIGLIAVVMAFYREKPLPTETIVTAIKSLTTGKYKTRLTIIDSDQLADVAQAVNELAKNLENEYKKQEEIKRNLREELLPGVKQKEVTLLEHSIHPELGPVCTIYRDGKVPTFVEQKPVPMPIPDKTVFDMAAPVHKEQKFRNTLIESNPPKEEEAKASTSSSEEQDLGELYQRFIDAQREMALDQIEYGNFLKTIESTRDELMKSYQCRTISFDIVTEQRQVALQPKIIR